MRSSMMIVIITVIGVILYQSSNHVALATEMGDGYGPETVTNFAGYMHVHNNTRHLWYWFFESRNAPSTDPFVLWMTGGPGCSSLVALFNENGPYIIQDDLSLKLNPYSWNTRTNILFIDQPVNTGFSYSDFGDIGVVSEAEMAQDMWEFFQHFFQQYPKYAKLPLYITGESYAGHYIPALAHRIYEQNNKHVGLPINLKGIAIGNGLVDPITQFPQYAPYAYQHNVTTKTQFELMEALIPECVALIAACSQNSTLGWLACINAYVMCSYAELIPVQFTGINVYDVREPCRVAPLCYNFTLTEKLLAMPSVRQALNVGSRKWVDCNRLVDLELVFAGDWMVSMATAIPDLLASSIDVLVYSGEYDFICNWYGGQAWTNALKWPGQGSFNKAMNTTWHVNGNVAGSSKAYQGFTFLRVANAGHMVPLNQPVNALSMLQTFIDRKPFN